jgi:hypothetical protein
MTNELWHIGIDEAGYGPNLGPLVMTAVACRAPDADLWDLLQPAVRRCTDEDDGRLVVADSKVVYTPDKGLQPLEKSVAALLWPAASADERPIPLTLLLEKHARACLAELRAEFWFHGQTALPVAAAHDDIRHAGAKVRRTAHAAGLHLGLVQSVIVCPPRFNALLERWDSKAAVLGLGLADLLGYCLDLPGQEPFEIIVDKHGGRNTYSALVQHACPDGFVLAREEGALRSFYEVHGLARRVHITFMPRADGTSFCVALASMVSKYLREVLMGEFNHFWLTHVPGLKPTAGYPLDADRFFQDISPALARLGIPREKIWRLR